MTTVLRCWPLILSLLPFFACEQDIEPPDELVPLRVLLAPPTIEAPQLSPDGHWISYIAPVDGVQNLMVAPVDSMEAARPITRFTDRGVQATDVSGNVMYRWSIDGTRVIFPRDQNGDENWHVYVAEIATGDVANLTPIPGAQVRIMGLSDVGADVMLVAINDRIPQLHDLYRLNIRTGERQLVMENNGFLAMVADNDLEPRIGITISAQGGFAIYKATSSGEWEVFDEVPTEDVPALSASGYQQITRFDANNDQLYYYDSQGRNTAALIAHRLSTGEKTVVAADERVDIGGVMYHPKEHTVQAYATNWTRTEWHALDDAIADDLDALKRVADGDITVESRSRDDQRWLVRYTLSDAPYTYYLYDRADRSARKLFTTTPQLEGLPLAKMHPIVVQSRDGFDLVSYITLPRWTDPDEDGKPHEPVPMIVLVHGGPSDERAQFAFGPFVHWLANRGYAVLYANFRGSPGFGKEFMNAQRLEWGGKMNEDLIDQVEWAIAEGVTTRDRVAILGGSYGGYATLVGMTITPDVYACGIDLVGPSSLEVFMPHWNVDLMSQIVGDPRTEEGRAHLRARSPINFAHQILNPILIGQGANDSRVPQAQSDNMVETMVENGAQVVYALYPDEGHGLLRPENSYSFWAIAEIFLAQCLDGRYQPLTDELEGSSVQVPVGAEHIPGLEEALQRRGES